MSRWLHIPRPAPDAAVRLFCVPHAGGGAAVYREWSDELDDCEVVAVRLPGRENRFTEPPYEDMRPVVAELTDAVAPCTDRPYALFGHSMGARVVYEVARELHRRGAPPARRLFVSACPAPSVAVPAVPPDLPRDEFVARLADLGAPPEFLAQPELLDLLLPVVRADYAVVQSHRPRPGARLPVPVTALCGAHDRHVPPAHTRAWAAETATDFAHHVLAGDHFFLGPCRAQVLDLVATALRRDVGAIAVR